MAISTQEIDQLSQEFRRCQKLLTALGDETRQHLILEMMQIPDCSGARVNAITERTNLSRPAVSHHIGILKEAGLVKMRREGGLHIQLVLEEPRAFNSAMAHYGKFSGVRNYVALVGKKGPELQERCGYYGEKIVLCAQQRGLNICWVAMTYKKRSPPPSG